MHALKKVFKIVIFCNHKNIQNVVVEITSTKFNSLLSASLFALQRYFTFMISAQYVLNIHLYANTTSCKSETLFFASIMLS